MTLDSPDNAKRYLEAIQQALIKEWDPIGVGEFPEAQNEYDPNASRRDWRECLRRSRAGSDQPGGRSPHSPADGSLTGESSPDFGAITATLDANGNRTALAYPGAWSATFTYDPLNRDLT
jgi:hypothetical protein